jgi:hypothetical protein
VAGRGDKKEEAFWVPVGPCDHCLAFDHCDYVSGFICTFEDTVVAVELIEWNVENALH